MNDLEAKTFVITGANTGIGRVTANTLAQRGAHVILACRTLERTQPVLDEIGAAGGQATFVQVDLADLGSVRRCAQQLLGDQPALHGLVNNAGIGGARGKSPDGFELAFATNHLGHYLLTRLLLPTLREHSPVRIVNISSNAHYAPKTVCWETLTEPTKTRTGFREYSVSKLCNVLFTKELARRFGGDGITALAAHPGVVATDVWRNIPAPLRWIMKRFMVSPSDGAQSTITAVTQTDLVEHNGAYVDWNCQLRKPAELADDVELARELWSRSAAWVGLPD